jgi:short subunit dehydrogenase-like uncharacterized protein
MGQSLLIYGATGYSGRLIVEEARRRGLRPILAGRNAAALSALGEAVALEHRPASLADPARLRQALGGVAVVLNAAGPFSATAGALIDACLDAGAHYLDISGEIAAIEEAARRHAQAAARGRMLMPGVGFDVVPSDCLARHLAARLPGAVSLRLGIAGIERASRGSARTIVEQIGRGACVRRQGSLHALPAGSLTRAFDYGAGPRPSVAVSWGDVASAYYSTGIPNIETYFEATALLRGGLAVDRSWGWLLSLPPWPELLKGATRLLPEGPTEAQRRQSATTIVAEVEDAAGRRLCARLFTPEVYTFTATASVAIAERVLGGDLEVGFQTPSRVFGGDFVLALPGVRREDA